MQLEKATSHSSEAGLAGWISSNDVTLLTMVLVVVIALFLHAKLIKGTEELASTNKDLASTSKLLAAARQDLDQTRRQRDSLDAELQERRRQLQETENDLQVARKQRDELDSRLSAALQRIANLGQSIQELTARKTQLEADKAALSTQGASLAKDKATLSEKLNTLAAQLEEKVKLLADAEKQRDRLKQQADELDAIIAGLQQKLNLTKSDMEKLQAQSAQQMAQATTQVRQLEEKAQAETARAEDYLARLRRAAELFKGLQSDKQNLETQVTNLQQQYQQQVTREATISRELVGLKGALRRVAVLFDASGSMKEQGTSDDDRWSEAQKIATTWLAHLDFDQCVLIVFSSDVRTFPEDGSLIRVSGPEGETNRTRLMEQVSAVKPGGWTNTLEALRTAYRYDGIDSIILFSDGAPTNPNSGRFDPAVAQEIYALCRQHAQIPVNAVGLGNYFDQEMATFLRTVARLTGGTFRGR